MNIVIDIVLAALAVFIIVQYTVRGFVRSVLGAAKLLLSALSALIFTPMIFVGVDTTSMAVGYLFMFSGSYIVLSVIVFIIDKIFELPLLNIVNKLLGLALGVVSAYVTLTIVCSILSVFLGFSAESLFGMTADEIYATTYIYRFFKDFSLFSLIG